MGDADMTADDAEHTLAMLDAGTFDLRLTAAARQRLSAPGRCASTASPMWSRSASPAAGISCDGVVPACGKRHVRGWPWDSVEPGAPRPHCRFLSPHDYYIPAGPGSCWRTLMLGRGARRPPMRPQEPVPPGRG